MTKYLKLIIPLSAVVLLAGCADEGLWTDTDTTTAVSYHSYPHYGWHDRHYYRPSGSVVYRVPAHSYRSGVTYHAGRRRGGVVYHVPANPDRGGTTYHVAANPERSGTTYHVGAHRNSNDTPYHARVNLGPQMAS